MSGGRKRRSIQEDSEEDDDEMASPMKTAAPEESNPLSAAALMKNRLRERLERSEAKAAANKKRKSDDDDGKNNDSANDEVGSKVNAIPKKKKEPTAVIPKKDPESGSNKPSSSLLAMMKQAPPPPSAAADSSTANRSKLPPGNHNTSFSRPNRPPHQHPSQSLPRGRPSYQSNRGAENYHPPRDIATPVVPSSGLSNSGPGKGPPQNTVAAPVGSHPSPQPPRPKRNAKLEQMVWDTLHEVCQDQIKDFPVGFNNDTDKASSIPTFEAPSTNKRRQGVDMSGSILRMKQSSTQHSVIILPSTEAEEDLDFFDLDNEGCIVVQPVIPMFPEDFPNDSEQKSWPLSWFGIADPNVDIEKEKAERLSKKKESETAKKGSTSEDKPTSKRDRSKRDRHSDKRKHDTSKRYARKESDDRRHDDDHDHFDESRGHGGKHPRESGNRDDGRRRHAGKERDQHHDRSDPDVRERRPPHDERYGITYDDRYSERYGDERYPDNRAEFDEDRMHRPPPPNRAHPGSGPWEGDWGPVGGFRGGRGDGRGIPHRGGFRGGEGGRGFRRSPSWDRRCAPGSQQPTARHRPADARPGHADRRDYFRGDDYPPVGGFDLDYRFRDGDFPPGPREGRHGPGDRDFRGRDDGGHGPMGGDDYPPPYMKEQRCRPRESEYGLGDRDHRERRGGDRPLPPAGRDYPIGGDRNFGRDYPDDGERDFGRDRIPPSFRGGRGGGRGGGGGRDHSRRHERY
ncbi:hypothetical protein IV203_023419 [Nitzschia inconspicua]|uniref:Uncharacterized protein n=1 Tax=Nitzschia inconspicua TaxID=303405 RepID=A0A9K3KDF9_9STRA|nr:hypothetical protein IV203_023419 [Nitzschia inconspicua]